VAGCSECGDEPSGFDATNLVISESRFPVRTSNPELTNIIQEC
jgi:hypothetical protein